MLIANEFVRLQVFDTLSSHSGWLTIRFWKSIWRQTFYQNCLRDFTKSLSQEQAFQRFQNVFTTWFVCLEVLIFVIISFLRWSIVSASVETKFEMHVCMILSILPYQAWNQILGQNDYATKEAVS